MTMNRILISLLLAISFVNISSANVIHSSWIGQDQDQWTNPVNWVPQIVPQNNAQNSYAVTIDSNQHIRIEAGNINDYQDGIQINTLDCYGDIDLEFGEVSLVLKDPNGITNYGKFQISGAGVEHTIRGNFNNTDTGYFQAANYVDLNGALNNAGELFVIPNGNLSVDGNIVNNGKFQLYNGTLSCGSAINNIQGGSIEGSGIIFSMQGFMNNGTITASGQLQMATYGYVENRGILCNSPLGSLIISQVNETKLAKNVGTIKVNAGGVAFNGELDNEPNGVIELKNGVIAASIIKHSKGAMLEGFGGITGDLVMESESLIKITGPTNIIGDLYIAPDAVLQITEGTMIVTGKTTCEGTVSLTGGHIVYQGGLE